MLPSILVAGIGNIFHGDDSFGIEVLQKLALSSLPGNVRLMDIGIRGVDLAFAMLDGYETIILIDATSQGGPPGTLYTMELDPDDLPDGASLANAHGLDPASVLSAAKNMGARFGKVFLVGCEPLVLESENGRIGLSDVVQAAVRPAVETVQKLLQSLTLQEVNVDEFA